MSKRIHTTEAKSINIVAIHRSDFAKQLTESRLLETVTDLPHGAALVLEDPGNMEALLILGEKDELILLGRLITDRAHLIPDHDPTTVDGKIRNLLEEYPLQDPAAITDDELFGDDLGRYLLVEESEKGGGHYFSRHLSPEDAASYHDNQEYANDWTIVTLIDLETGEEMQAETNTRFK